jgi:hypothetical protein
MISPKTTALIAAMSLLGAVTPAAFAQNGNTVTADQSNSFSATISQSQSPSRDASSQEQGFCLQANQQNAAAGNDATNTASNTISASDRSEVDC